MPGPKHGTPRRAGARPDPEGNARKPERKAARRLAARIADVTPLPTRTKDGHPAKFHKPGSQNRKK